jgi:hypothetical protein
MIIKGEGRGFHTLAGSSKSNSFQERKLVSDDGSYFVVVFVLATGRFTNLRAVLPSLLFTLTSLGTIFSDHSGLTLVVHGR